MLSAFVLSGKENKMQHRFKIQIGNVNQRCVHEKSNAKNKMGRRAAPKRCLLNRSPADVMPAPTVTEVMQHRARAAASALKQ